MEGFDHHCSFLDSCIGKHNYSYFLGFLCSIVLLSISETAGFLIYLFSVVSQNALIGNDYRTLRSSSHQELRVPRSADRHDRHPRLRRQPLRRRAALLPHLPARTRLSPQVVGKTTKETIKAKNKPFGDEGLAFDPPKSPGLRQNLFSEIDKLQEKVDQRRPFLNFSMILTKEEAEYLSNFEVCLNDRQP